MNRCYNTLKMNCIVSLTKGVKSNFIQFYTKRCMNSGKLPVLTLFTKDNCSLCDEAMKTLQPYRQFFELKEVDITLPENKNWFKLYKYDIPVFHMNGDFLMKHKADLIIFKKRLKELGIDVPE